MAVALSMLALALLTGVISWDKVLQCKSAWNTFIWYAGIISLANGLNSAKFFVWLGKTFIPVIFTMGAAAKLPPIPLLLMCAASAQIASQMTHYGNAVGPVLYGAGYVDKVTWWKIGHIVTAVFLTIYFVVGLVWWKKLGLW